MNGDRPNWIDVLDRRGVVRGPSTLAVLLVLACVTGARAWNTNHYWIGGSATWDDTTTANWTPAHVPEHWDYVFLTQVTAGDIDIVYDTTHFGGDNEIRRGYLYNTGGGTTTLYLTSTNELEFNMQFYIQAGGRVIHTNGNGDHATLYLDHGCTYQFSGAATMQRGTFYIDGDLDHTSAGNLDGAHWYIGTRCTTPGQTGTLSVADGVMSGNLGINVGSVVDSRGVLTLGAGTIKHRTLARNENEYFTIGATNGSGNGLFLIRGGEVNCGPWGWDGCSMRVLLTGSVRGYGTIKPSNEAFRNDGKVIADGEGTDRTLDFSSTPYLTNMVDNTSDKGWYAVNGGELALMPVPVPAGASTNCWGESLDDETPDLVNSVRIAFSGITGSGTLAGSLLAADHSTVTPGLTDPVGVWEFTPSGFTMGAATLTIRYDDALCGALGVNENELRLWHDNGGTWADITAGRDAAANRITGNPVSGFSQFAVAAPERPQGTVITVR